MGELFILLFYIYALLLIYIFILPRQELRKEDLGGAEARSQWKLWVERWIGLSAVGGAKEADENRKVESRMDHWGVPCLSLCEKTDGESAPGQASVNSTAESITEWTSLRPHVCSETRWERYPDGTATLVKSLFVFDWREVISSEDNFCQPSEYYGIPYQPIYWKLMISIYYVIR